MTVNDNNDPILEWVEDLGGGYVWEPEVFAVTLLEVDFHDADAARLSQLKGVRQIAVYAGKLSLNGIKKLAEIPGIESLVLQACNLSTREIEQLRRSCFEVLLIE